MSLKSVNVKARFGCDICHDPAHDLELRVSIDGKTFNQNGWDAVEKLLEERRNDKSHSERAIRMTDDGTFLDVCGYCSKKFRGEA